MRQKQDKMNSSKPDINSQLVEELLSKTDPSELFGKDGLFQQLRTQIVERVLASELEHEVGYGKEPGRRANLCCLRRWSQRFS